MICLLFNFCFFDIIIGFYMFIYLLCFEQLFMLEKISFWLKLGGFVFVNFSKEDMEVEVIEEWLGCEEGWMFWFGYGVDNMLCLI